MYSCHHCCTIYSQSLQIYMFQEIPDAENQALPQNVPKATQVNDSTTSVESTASRRRTGKGKKGSEETILMKSVAGSMSSIATSMANPPPPPPYQMQAPPVAAVSKGPDDIYASWAHCMEMKLRNAPDPRKAMQFMVKMDQEALKLLYDPQ